MKRIFAIACLISLLLCGCDDDDSFVARPDAGSESVESSSSGKKVSSSSSSNSSLSSSGKEIASSSSSVKDETDTRYPNDRDLNIPAVVRGCKTELEDNCEYGSLEDERDGQVYKTVKIGGREWMAENLNYYVFDTYCYDMDSLNCEKYGRLYSWDEAFKACPEGWVLPTVDEWYALFGEVGGDDVAGYLLKASEGWEVYGNGIDAFGFSMLPAGTCLGTGCHDSTLAYYRGLSAETDFWALDDRGQGNSHEAIRCYPYYLKASCYWLDVDYHFSVRCIKKERSVE